ncbi:RICIN domain-containing protein [Saccharopolyspora sp. NPDC002376]
MATLAMAPALPASAQAGWGNSTEITNVADGTHWVSPGAGRNVESTTQTTGPWGAWTLERQQNGSTVFRNRATNECAESTMQANGPVFTAPCAAWKQGQQWDLINSPYGGFVITPKSQSGLAVVASQYNRGTELMLGERPLDTGGNSDTPNAVFRFNF